MRRNLDALAAENFDLLVIGGGITGAGAALDAALRGLRVALIDKGDFASGTSSVSSKLIHGGLRYLERGDFRLVYESLHERRRLLHNAAHLVHPLRFVLPFYAGARVPAWKQRLGLTLYDLLAGPDNLHRSRAYPLASLYHDFPDLQAQGLRGAAEFFDAQMDDARLCVEVMRTAAANGAVVANYVEATAFEKKEGQICGARAVSGPEDRQFLISARQILNAAGPWSDAVRQLAGDDASHALRPTKGVHLIAPGRGLAAAFLLLHPADGRVFFVIPWLGKTLIGTTDTVCDEPPDTISVAPCDVEYLLQGHNHYFTPNLSAADPCSALSWVCARWCDRALASHRPSPVSSHSRRRRRGCSPFPAASTRRIAVWPKSWSMRWCAGWVYGAVAAHAISGWTGRRVSRGSNSSQPPLFGFKNAINWRKMMRGISSGDTGCGPTTWRPTWSAIRGCAAASLPRNQICWSSSLTSATMKWLWRLRISCCGERAWACSNRICLRNRLLFSLVPKLAVRLALPFCYSSNRATATVILSLPPFSLARFTRRSHASEVRGVLLRI